VGYRQDAEGKMEGVQMAPCRGKSASKLPLSNKLPVISLTEAGGRMWPAMVSLHQSSHIKMPFVQGGCILGLESCCCLWCKMETANIFKMQSLVKFLL